MEFLHECKASCQRSSDTLTIDTLLVCLKGGIIRLYISKVEATCKDQIQGGD